MSNVLQDCCASLWNSDLLTIPRSPFGCKSFLFRGVKIKEVLVFGIVTSVERIKSIITHYVDDGTGVILCAYDEAMTESHHKLEICRFLDFYREPENIYLQGSMVLTRMLERALDIFDEHWEVQEGDSVCILGKISDSTEELRVVTISFITPLQDLRTEILLMELRDKFYESYLNKNKTSSVADCQNTTAQSENDSESDEPSDTDIGNNGREKCENKRRKLCDINNFSAIDCYVGEWHEEYFIYRNEKRSISHDSFDDEVCV